MDYQEIIERAPLPIMVLQDGRIAYANRSFMEVVTWAGYEPSKVQGSELALMVAPEEREASRKNIARMLKEPAAVHRNIARTLVDTQGNRYNALISVSRVRWNGKSALEASFVLLGRREPAEEGEDPQWGQDSRRRALEALTPRERRVAQLLAAGYSTDNIRAYLGVKESTVRSHIKAIYRKTDTRSRAELTRFLIGFRGSVGERGALKPGLRIGVKTEE